MRRYGHMGGTGSKKLGMVVALGALAVLACGLLVSGASAGGAKVSITSLDLLVGSEGTVELGALEVAEPGLGAWTIDVHYNPEVVTLLECSAEYGGICNPELAANAARVTGVSVYGLKGDSSLARLVFGCKMVGSSDLALSVSVLADATVGEPQPIEATLLHGDINCSEEPPKPAGDADCDGELSSVDAQLILQYGAELVDSVPCPDSADANGDGVINAIDAAIILQIVAGLK
jgi:hypothetical protein